MSSEPSDKPHDAITEGARFQCNLWYSTFQAFVDAVGLDQALEIMRPYVKSHFDAGTHIMKDKFKLETEDVCSVAVFQKIFFYVMSGSLFFNHRFFKQGFTADVSCIAEPYRSEALCRLIHGGSEYNLQIINNDYEIIPTKMLFKGDPFCQVMVKKKEQAIWDKEVKRTIELPIPEIPYEEREYWQSATYSQFWVYTTNALVDFAGKERAIEILSPYMRALGMSIANDLSNELGIKDRDALAIASIIDRCNQVAHQKGSYTYRTPDRADKEITECIFANASQDICADALEARSNGICEAINPLYEFHSTQRMCKGDKVCHWVIKKKKF